MNNRNIKIKNSFLNIDGKHYKVYNRQKYNIFGEFEYYKIPRNMRVLSNKIPNIYAFTGMKSLYEMTHNSIKQNELTICDISEDLTCVGSFTKFPSIYLNLFK